MKTKNIFILMVLLISFNISVQAQIKFKTLLDSIKWDCTESELLYNFRDYIEKGGQGENKTENSTSDFSFMNIDVNGVICKAPIRISTQTKKIYRINFMVFDNITEDPNIKMDTYLERNFGEPYLVSSDEVYTSQKEWARNHYSIRASCIAINNKHSYIISVEPLKFYPVKASEAKIEQNQSGITLPDIESFKIDNDENIIVKLKNNKDCKYMKTKKYNTQKGDVISFGDGMFCFREETMDIVYILKGGFAAIYPIDTDKFNLKTK